MRKKDFSELMVKSIKEGDTKMRDLLRVVISELDRIGKNPSDAEVDATLRKMVKNAEITNTPESLEEGKILNSFLPKGLTEAEVIEVIKRVKEDNPDVVGGRLIGLCVKACEGRADSKIISKLVMKG